jgi:hypothetical protein
MAQQHVQMYRKALLRRSLIRFAVEGSCYAPFCGSGDLAAIYAASSQTIKVYAADLDPKRVETCQSRYPEFITKVADCDSWPFDGVQDEFSVADFDAYAHPYDSFRSFWANANKARRVVMFFTDAAQQAVKQTGTFVHPNGQTFRIEDMNERRKVFNFYMTKVVQPWFENAIGPEWKVEKYEHYLRLGAMRMLYWGAVVTQK